MMDYISPSSPSPPFPSPPLPSPPLPLPLISTSDHSQDSDRTSSHHITSSVSINVPSSLGKVAHSAILRSTHSSSLEDSTDTRTSAHTHTQTSEEGTNSRKTSDSTIEGKIPRPLSHGPSTIPSSTVASSNAGTPSGMNTLSSRSKGTSGDTLSDVGNSSSSGECCSKCVETPCIYCAMIFRIAQ